MSPTPPHLKVLEEMERKTIPGLPEVLREEGSMRCAIAHLPGGWPLKKSLR